MLPFARGCLKPRDKLVLLPETSTFFKDLRRKDCCSYIKTNQMRSRVGSKQGLKFEMNLPGDVRLLQTGSAIIAGGLWKSLGSMRFPGSSGVIWPGAYTCAVPVFYKAFLL